jgi:hypothetical protein
MSSKRTMAKFSGRVMVPKVTIGVVARLRPSNSRSAKALPMASGSGSCCSKIWIFLPLANSERMRSTFLIFNVSSSCEAQNSSKISDN